MTNAAIFFEPDGYVLSGPKLMGRQAAGNAFLRAAIALVDPGERQDVDLLAQSADEVEHIDRDRRPGV